MSHYVCVVHCRTRRLMRRGKGEPHGAARVASMLQSVPQIMVKEEPSDDVLGEGV